MVHEQPKEMFKLLARQSDNLFEKLVGEKDQCPWIRRTLLKDGFV